MTSILTLFCIYIVASGSLHRSVEAVSLRNSYNPIRAAHHHSNQINKKFMHRSLSSSSPVENIMALSTTSRMASKISETTSRSKDRDICIRILCLHGKGGNGNQFVDSSLRPLRSLVEQRVANQQKYDKLHDCQSSFHWEHLTAPYEILSGDDSGGFSWWTMPPGVRSYNAQEVRLLVCWSNRETCTGCAILTAIFAKNEV